MSTSFHRFPLGPLTCTALADGTFLYDAPSYVANAEPEEVARALARHGVEPNAIPSPYTCLLVQTPPQRILLDAGAGPLAPTAGKLTAALGEAGVTPAEIDVIVLTHGHPDHIGGITDDRGALTFPHAHYVMSVAEWTYWTNEDVLASLPPVFAAVAQKNLPPIAERVELVQGESEVVPGVRVLPAPGHTPGQLAVLVESDGETLLYVADAALHPIHLEHPDWYPIFDADPQQALATKRRLLDRAAAEDMLVLAFHFDPFPSLGHVHADGDAWAWEPATP